MLEVLQTILLLKSAKLQRLFVCKLMHRRMAGQVIAMLTYRKNEAVRQCRFLYEAKAH